MKHVYVLIIAQALTGCAFLRPAANVVEAACALGVRDTPEVQAAAETRGVSPAQLAAALCALPAVLDAWEAAGDQRADPARAAVRVAQREGLL
jgi:DNA-binding transcriptional regulator YiaG